MKKNRVLLFLTLFCVAILKVHAQKIPIEIVNNSVFPDDKVYVAIIGKKVSDDAPIYYDLIANNASDAALRALPVVSLSFNTVFSISTVMMWKKESQVQIYF